MDDAFGIRSSLTTPTVSSGRLVGKAVVDFSGTGTDENPGFSIIKPFEFPIEVSGMETILANWRQVSDELRERATEIAFDAATEVYNESQIQVPFKEGYLQRSGYVEEERGNLSEGYVSFLVGYDKDNKLGYAWDQHDSLDYHHSEGRKAKYLEDPANEMKAKMPSKMAQELSVLVDSFKARAGGPRLAKKVK